MRRPNVFWPFVLGLVTIATASAVETSFWQIATFEEFLQGTLSGVSLSKEGRLRLGPEFRTVFTLEEPLALSLAADSHRNVYVGTGHQGKVFRLDADMKPSLFFKAEEPDVFALAVGPDGALYVGSSPEGKIYRVAPDGKAETFYEPKAKYVWALALDERGNLYVGTGDKGQILRIDPNRKGEVFFDSKQTHIMCLAFDRERNLLAGSVPSGLIYRITPQGKAFVLYQTGFPEVREIALDNSGNVYAAALGSVTGKGTPDLFQPQLPSGQMPAAVTTVTVTASSGGDSAAEVQQAPPQQPSGMVTGRPAPAGVAFPTLQIPQGRGALIRILPDYTAETIWSSNSDSLFALAVRDQHVLFSTDTKGRVFDLDLSDSRQKLTLLSETQESVATRLLLQGPSLFIATSSAAKLFRAGSAAAREGTYESPVKDAKFISRWGVVSWRGEVPAGTKVGLFTRSGNSERPDQTWTEWAGPYTNPAGSPILSAPARFIQWKAVLQGNGEASPVLDEVSISYLNQNLPPQVRSVSVSTASERTSPGGTASGTPSASPGLVGTSGAPSATFGSGMGGAAGMGKTPVVVSWQADDPNGDQLTYYLYAKATDEQEWHLLKDKLRQNNFTIEPNTLADGKYMAKLVASDELSNPPALFRTAELQSAPFWIDNTPPRVTVLRQTAASGQIKIQFQVEDNASPVRAAEVAIDNKEWETVHADDGVADSLTETFTAQAQGLNPGEHLFALRATDSAGNVGVGKAVVQVPVQRDRTR